jgi:hypothetical protein
LVHAPRRQAAFGSFMRGAMEGNHNFMDGYFVGAAFVIFGEALVLTYKPIQ